MFARKVEPDPESAAASRRARRNRKLEQIEISENKVSISADELLVKGGFREVYIGDHLGRNVACKVSGWVRKGGVPFIFPHDTKDDSTRSIGPRPRYYAYVSTRTLKGCEICLS